MSTNRFYVYGLYYEDKLLDKCFYVGKGSKDRLNHHLCDSLLDENHSRVYNYHKVRKIKKLKRNNIKVYARKIISNLEEDEAYREERKIINEIGIKNLTNITPGGKGGPSGKDHPMYGKSPTRSKDSIEKTRKALKGREISKEQKNKISETLSGRSLKNSTKDKISNSLKNKSKKLSKKQVGEIKWYLNNTELYQREIADKYPITQTMVSNINNTHIWKNISQSKPNPDDQKEQKNPMGCSKEK